MKNRYKNSIKSLFSESMTDGKVDKVKVARIFSIIRNLPYPHNGIILKAYAGRIMTEIEKYTLTVTTAHEMSNNFIQKVKTLFSETIIFEEKEINQDVLGGFRAQLGSQVLDMTVREQIRQLEGSIL